MSAVEHARLQREIRQAERLRTLERVAPRGARLAPAAAALPPGDVQAPSVPAVPSGPAEVVAVRADQPFDPSGTFAVWVATVTPPDRSGFAALELPSTVVPLTVPAVYTVSLEVDWLGGPGGVVEVWVGDQRAYVAPSGPRLSRDVLVTSPATDAPLQVALRHSGAAPVRAAVAATVTLGHRVVTEFDDREPEQSPEAVPGTPDAPGVVAGATLDNAYLDVSWTPVEGADAYEVRAVRVDLGERLSVHVPDGTDVRIEWLLADTEYDVTVAAVMDGRFGEHSAPTRATTVPDQTVPSQVQGLTISAAFTSATATWDENPEIDVRAGAGRYEGQLSEGQQPDPAAPWVDMGPGTVRVFGPLTMDTWYTGRVRAVDRSGNVGPPSDPVVFRTSAVVDIEFELEDNSVTLAKLADNAVNSAKLVDEAVTNAKLAQQAVDESRLALEAVTADILAAQAVTETKIAADAVTTPKLAAGAVVAGKLAADSVIASKIQAGAVTAAKIQAEAVTAAKIQAEAVTTAKLDAGAVTTAKLDALAVTAEKIAAEAVTTFKIAADSIVANHIRAGAVTAEKIAVADLVADDAFLANLVVGSANIAEAAIEDAHVGSLSASKLTAGTLDAGIIQLGPSGVLLAGDLQSGTFLGLDRSGLYLYNGGVETVALSAATGNATFRGTVHATAGEIEGPLTVAGSLTSQQWNPEQHRGWQLSSDGNIGLSGSVSLRTPDGADGELSHSWSPTAASAGEWWGTLAFPGPSATQRPRLEAYTNGFAQGKIRVRSADLVVGGAADVTPAEIATGTRTGVAAAGGTGTQPHLALRRSSAAALYVGRNTSDGEAVMFRRSGSQVGDISVTTTATAYNTSSDHRLKTDVRDLDGSPGRLRAVRPVRHRWVTDPDAVGVGFVAHELAEVFPLAVTGERDEVDEAGEPVYQGVDASRLVPDLVAGWQDLDRRLAALEGAVS